MCLTIGRLFGQSERVFNQPIRNDSSWWFFLSNVDHEEFFFAMIEFNHFYLRNRRKGKNVSIWADFHSLPWNYFLSANQQLYRVSIELWRGHVVSVKSIFWHRFASMPELSNRFDSKQPRCVEEKFSIWNTRIKNRFHFSIKIRLIAIARTILFTMLSIKAVVRWVVYPADQAT